MCSGEQCAQSMMCLSRSITSCVESFGKKSITARGNKKKLCLPEITCSTSYPTHDVRAVGPNFLN